MNIASPDINSPAPIHTPEYYERLLNPDKILPKVKFSGSGGDGWRLAQLTDSHPINFALFALSSPGDKKMIGEGSLDISEINGKKKAMINMIRITENDFLNKWFGRAAYLEILKYLGDTQLQSGKLTPKTRKVWEWLVEKGVALKIYPGSLFREYEII